MKLRAAPLGPIPSGVRTYDCPLRFFVASRSRGKNHKCEVTRILGPIEHICDFTEEQFPHGRCSCEDFQIRVESYLVRGQEPEKRRCWHLRRCLAFMAWHLELWNQYEDDEPNRPEPIHTLASTEAEAMSPAGPVGVG